jgi:hypothetical protein
MPEPGALLQAQQFALARHLRDPACNPPPPGIEERRLAVHRELFHANIESLLAPNFPVIRATLGDVAWHALVRDFHADFRCQTPLFTGIGREFVRFVEEREAGRGDPPWLHELAHYEWVELALHIADHAVPAHDPLGDLLSEEPVLSPFAWALAYRWPVHLIGAGQQPDRAPDIPTLLLVRRDAAGDVAFAELSPLVYRMLELLDAGDGSSGDAVLRTLAAEANADDVAAFVRDGAAMLRRLHEEGTILGTRRRESPAPGTTSGAVLPSP